MVRRSEKELIFLAAQLNVRMFQVQTKTMYRFFKIHVDITSLPTKQQGAVMIIQKE
jgi:hypothetical protein